MRLIGYILLLVITSSGWNTNVWLHYCGGSLEEVSLLPEEQDDCCSLLCKEDCCEDRIIEIESALQDLQHNRSEIHLNNFGDFKDLQLYVVLYDQQQSESDDSCRTDYDRPPPQLVLAGREIRLEQGSLVYYG